MNQRNHSGRNELNEVAIVGIGCRFPGGADNPQAFFSLLLNGQDAITEIPPDRWAIDSYYHPRQGISGKSATKWGGFVADIDRFDAEFFGISPREAATMDPQQRMLLEVCWEAMEDAGCVPSDWRGRQVGVFVGGFTLDYMLMQLGGGDYRAVEPHTATGSMMTLLANRLSYVFDFRGTSLAVDTACSSSLVGIHLACRSLIAGESELAIAGGVNALLGPSYTVAESRAGMMSPSGRSRAFDASADGYVRGEGAGLVVLKRLDYALADDDHIYAVIRGTGSNQDGHSDGLTVPSGDAQMALMSKTLDFAKVTPRELSYVEAHGTGTPVGDPIEASAIGRVVREGRGDNQRCLLGSVKTVFGHTEAAAGVAGLIKTALSLENRMVPPHQHLQCVNPNIDLSALKLDIPCAPRTLPQKGTLFASVNSFGFGGTNAHAVLATAPKAQSVYASGSTTSGHWSLPLSARHADALPLVCARFAERLMDRDGELSDLCGTAATRREHHPHRACVTGANSDELAEALRALAQGDSHPAAVTHTIAEGHKCSLAFVYCGMGPQWWAMGRDVYAKEPVFAAAVDRCLTLFEQIAGWSLRDALFADEQSSRMGETEIAQPSSFILQVALTDLLKSWDIRPARIVGHSAGEPAAAYAAGVFTLEDAIRITYARSHWQQTTTGQGRLLAVGLTAEQALAEIAACDDPSISLAAVNGPESVTIVGGEQGIASLQERLKGARIFARALKVRVPYHSIFMEPLRAPLLADLEGIEPRTALVPLYSTVTGAAVSGPELDAEYWYRNVRQTVLFLDATKALLADGINTFVELGPHPVLLSSVKETAAVSGKMAHTVATLRREGDELAHARRVIGALHVLGYNVDWAAAQGVGRWTRLPTYPWRDTRYWHETPHSHQSRLAALEHPILARRVDAHIPTWEADLEGRQLAYLDDHRIQGVTVFPGAGYISMALHAARNLYGDTDALAVRNIVFEKALYLSAEQPLGLRISVDPVSQIFTIASRAHGAAVDAWERHCMGCFMLSSNHDRTVCDIDTIRTRCPLPIARDDCYRHFRNLGLEYGPAFQGIEELWQGENEALARIEVPTSLLDSLGDYDVHPAVLDVCFQTLAAALPLANQAKVVYMPTGVKNGRRYAAMTRHMWIHARIDELDRDGLRGDIRLYNQDAQAVIDIDGCTARALGVDAAQSVPQQLFEIDWQVKARGEPRGYATEGAWVVHGGNAELRHSTAMALRRADRTVFEVDSESFDSRDADAWRERLAAVGPSLRGVIHLAGPHADMDPMADIASACLPALALTQAMTDLNLAERPRLWFVTRATQAVDEQAVVDPCAASLWGLGRVIGHAEHVEIWGGMIDLGVQPSGQDGEYISAECLAPDHDDEIAWRDGTRYVSRLTECPNEVALPRAPVLRSDASYLITGGLGALGLEVAQWMAKQGARHLVLIGRTGLPERSQWRDIDLPAATRARIEAVLALEALGCQVRVEALDIADETAVRSLIACHQTNCYPAVRGVIHSAGVAYPQLMADMHADDFMAVISGKVQGAWNFHRALDGQELDFFVLFSSVAGVITSMGQSNYAAANTSLDALAHLRRAQGLPAISIDWGPWGDVGMATQLDLLKFFHDRGLFPMSAVQGTRALGQLLSGRRAQVVVLGAHWKTVAETMPLGIAAPLIHQVLDAEAQREQGRANKQVLNVDFKSAYRACGDDEARMALLQCQLHELVCRVLRVEPTDLALDDTLNSRGMDSMIAIELRNRIEHSLGVRMAIVDLLKGATVESLAGLASAALRDPVAAEPAVVAVADSAIDDLAAALASLTPRQIDVVLAETATSE